MIFDTLRYRDLTVITVNILKMEQFGSRRQQRVQDILMGLNKKCILRQNIKKRPDPDI